MWSTVSTKLSWAHFQELNLNILFEIARFLYIGFGKYFIYDPDVIASQEHVLV